MQIIMINIMYSYPESIQTKLMKLHTAIESEA